MYAKVYSTHTMMNQIGDKYPVCGKLTERELEHLRTDYLHKVMLPVKYKNPDKPCEDEKTLRQTGFLFNVISLKKKGDKYEYQVEVRDRIKMETISGDKGYLEGEYIKYPLVIDLEMDGEKEMIELICERLEQNHGFSYTPTIRTSNRSTLALRKSLTKVIYEVSMEFDLTDDERYSLMEAESLNEQALILLDYISCKKLKDVSEMEFDEDLSYEERIVRTNLTSVARKVAKRELNKLETIRADDKEYYTVTSYLDYILELPWERAEAPSFDFDEAQKILDSKHYGMHKVKERIRQHFATLSLRKDKSGSILLLVGPPGVGKTSIAKSIAKALGRKLERISLGGVSDEAKIRGFLRTYLGSKAGGILEAIRKAGCTNPIILLDEVDKMSASHRGDPSAALLEALDPEQNNTFEDHYLGFPYDLSDVLFIATANELHDIPSALRDRMEVIELGSYTSEEKFHIAKRYIVEKVLENHGLEKEQVQITDDALKKIVSDYTCEAGVRELQRKVETIARVAAEAIVSGEVTSFEVCTDSLEKIIGKRDTPFTTALTTNCPGVVNGLSTDKFGGHILPIEATVISGGTGQVILTGQLGDVMIESANICLSLLKTKFPLFSMKFKDIDIHMHSPSGAIPKEGPSAGIAMFSALASRMSDLRVDPLLAITGEITLTGEVLPVGGIAEKILGAIRAGMKKVIVPAKNAAEVEELSEDIKESIQIITVEDADELLREVFGASSSPTQCNVEEYLQKMDKVA